MPGCIVVNSTPLIALCKIGRLELLKSLYSNIVIPEAVFREVTAKDDSACNAVKTTDWIAVRKVQNPEDRKMYKARLHDGEVEVMILAQEEKADMVIIDDNAAKVTAKYLGLSVTGTLGILLVAYEKGLIDDISAEIAALKKNGFYISRTVEELIKSKIK